MNLSLCLTTFNRFHLTIESFAQIINDSRIDDIVILDDASTDGSFEKLVEHYKDILKVRMIRQAQNRGMSMNKRDAIGYAKNEWCVILDSDNVIGPDYLDAIEKTMLYGDTIYCPSFAMPEFDYRRYESFTVKKGDAAKLIREDMFNTCMNTCNCLVHRDTYLQTYRHNPAHIASDTIWHAYNHLKAGGSFYIVPGMQYFHRVHKGSGFLENAGHNMRMAQAVRELIMQL